MQRCKTHSLLCHECQCSWEECGNDLRLVGAGASGHVRAFRADVHSPGQQPGATAVDPGVLPLPEAPGSLAEGPAGSSCLLCLLAQKGIASLLLAGSLLLPSGSLIWVLLILLLLSSAPCQCGVLHPASVEFCTLPVWSFAPCQFGDCAIIAGALSSAIMVKSMLELDVCHI